MWESRESSSPILTRAVSAALQGKRISNYEFNLLQRCLLSIIGYFPQQLALKLIPAVQKAGGLEPGLIDTLQMDDLIAERIDDYSTLTGKKPAVVLGLPIGGAAGHLASGLNAPFLPHSFVLTIKGGAPEGNVNQYFQAGQMLARTISSNNKRVATIQHYDPVHDGWLTKYANHIRIKLLYLPDQYKAFIKQHVHEGGHVIILNGTARWPQFQVGADNYFQVGGWGGITAREFLQGSPRLLDYCQQNGLGYTDWNLEGYPLKNGFESEWGSQPGFMEDVQDWCLREGYKCGIISFEDPNDFSRLAFHAYRELFRKNNMTANGVLVEMFSQYDLTEVIRSGLLPLWLIFNTTDSLAFMKSMLSDFPARQPVFFSPLSTFSLTPDLVPYQSWEKALKKFWMVNVGARKTHYPADTRALAGWQASLIKQTKSLLSAKINSLCWEDLYTILKDLENRNC